MKVIVVAVLALTSFAYAEVEKELPVPGNTAYGYLKNIGIPEAERIRAAEESFLNRLRIVGGVPAGIGQYPYQAGLLLSMIGINGTGVCGGSLISANRVATAAHCWFDGVHQAWKATVVLGSTTLFTGGTRIDTSAVATHPSWFPLLVRNDVAVIYLPNPVTFSSTIAPVSLPSGPELLEDFAGSAAIASGYGLTSTGASITSNQFLSHVRLNVITNSACALAFPFVVQPSNLCTSGLGGVGTCNGDSGGPLVVNRDGKNILIGLTSFGSALGCQINLPSAFARVTSFVTFFNQHLN